MNRLDISLIRDLPPFTGMEVVDLQNMLAQATSQRHEKGATIFSESEDANYFYLLLDGHIRVVKINQNGEQMIARYISAGELYGIAKAIGRRHLSGKRCCCCGLSFLGLANKNLG